MFPPKDTTQGSGERSRLWARARIDGKYARMTWSINNKEETITFGRKKKKNQPVCTLKTVLICCWNHNQEGTPEHNLWRSSGAEPPGSCQSSLWPSAASPPHAGFGLRLWNGGCTEPAGLSPGMEQQCTLDSVAFRQRPPPTPYRWCIEMIWGWPYGLPLQSQPQSPDKKKYRKRM